MTDAAPTYRPSPRPRPAADPSRPEDGPLLRIVPPTLQPETATADNTPSDHVSAGHDHAGHATSPVSGVQIAGWRALISRTRGYWTPPAIFTDRPASLADLADYARHAPWTHQHTGPVRTLGVGYYRLGAYPYTAWSRYREWVAQRPLRLAAHLGGLKLAAMTGPGIWAVDHLIYPAARLAGHLFL